MEPIAQLQGEVVSIAVSPDGRVAVGTNRGDACILTGISEEETVDMQATAFVCSLVDVAQGKMVEIRATWAGSRLCLLVAGDPFGCKVGRTLRVLDLEQQTARELWRIGGDEYIGLIICDPVVVGSQAFIAGFQEAGGYVQGVSLADEEGAEPFGVVQLKVESDGVPLNNPDEEEEGILPIINHLLAHEPTGRLFLLTIDDGNCDGNRIRTVTLGEDGKASDYPATLFHIDIEPYPPVMGGACVNFYTGEAACAMYMSEHETFVPIAQIPQEGDWLPCADLYTVEPGEEAHHFAIKGRLGHNIAFYDREADAPNLPHNFRICWEFGNAGNEVTPVVATGPNTYAVALWLGTLLQIDTDTGEQTHLHDFDEPITALGFSPVTNRVYVGLSSGEVYPFAIAGG